MDKNTLRKCDIVFGFLLAIASLIFAIISFRMPWDGISGGGIYAAPGLMPLIVSSAIFFMSISVAINGIKEAGFIKISDITRLIKYLNTVFTKRVALMALIIIIYAFVLLGRIPFGLSTFIYLFSFMFLFRRENKWWVCLIVSVISSFLITFFFGSIINIPLP